MILRFFLIDAPDIQLRDEASKRFEMHRLPISIGRGANNHISLTDPSRTVSRNHARIIEKEGRILIEDLASKNFTYLNNNTLPAHQLREIKQGDVIQCGDFTLRVEVLDLESFPLPHAETKRIRSDTKVAFEGYEDNPFDGVAIELINTLERLNTIYNQVSPAVRDAMLSESIGRTIKRIEESDDVVQLIADSFSKTGLLNKDLFVPKSGR